MTVQVTKVCRRCELPKPADLDHFYAHSHTRDRLGSWCKRCVVEAGEARAQTLEGRETRNRSSRNYKRKRDYGMTQEAYDSMLAGQLGLCAICGDPETRENSLGATQQLCVDHDHSTGTIRGLLCDRCNTLLGKAGDDAALLVAAAAYLQRSSEEGGSNEG